MRRVLVVVALIAGLFAALPGPAAFASPPSFVGVATDVTGNGGSTGLTVPVPAGAAGDLLVAVIGVKINPSTTIPSGFTAVPGFAGFNEAICPSEDGLGIRCQLSVSWKIATGSETSVSVVFGPNPRQAAGAVLRYAGTDTTAPIGVTGTSTGDSTSPTAPSITTTVADTVVLRLALADADEAKAALGSDPATSRFNLESSTPLASFGTDAVVFAGSDSTFASAGATGAVSWSLPSAEGWRGASFEIKPPAGNTAPTAVADGPYTVAEGGTVVLDGSGSSDAEDAPGSLTYEWDLDGDAAFGETGAAAAHGDEVGISPTFSAAGLDGPSSVGVYLRVTDTGALFDTDSTTVEVTNAAPSIDSLAITTPVNENGIATLSGTFSDAGTPDTHELDIDWDDDAVVDETVVVSGGEFSVPHQYLDDDPTATPSDTFDVNVTLRDNDLDTDTGSVEVTVANVAPSTIVLNVDAMVDENGTVSLSGSFADPGTLDTHTVDIAWGDGDTDTLTPAVGARTFAVTHQYLDDDPTITPQDLTTISVTVTDDDTASDTANIDTLVKNVAPLITGLTSSATFDDKALEGDPVTIDGTFADVGTQDIHTVWVDWGDLTGSMALVTQGAGSGSFTAEHTYAAGGVYTITVTVTDDDSGAAVDTTTAVVTGVGVNGGVLQIVGTDARDLVLVKRVKDEIDVFATFVSPRHRRFDPAGITAVEMWLCDGNDRGNVHQSIDLPATIHGGEGNDMLWGGSGNDTIFGEEGDDKLWGRAGDDLLDGGPGDDVLFGGSGSNILI